MTELSQPPAWTEADASSSLHDRIVAFYEKHDKVWAGGPETETSRLSRFASASLGWLACSEPPPKVVAPPRGLATQKPR